MPDAVDDYSSQAVGRNSPAVHCAAVTPDDDNDLTNVSRGIAFGTIGDLEIVTVGGDTITIPSGVLAAGIIHPIAIKRIKEGTTADDIHVFW